MRLLIAAIFGTLCFAFTNASNLEGHGSAQGGSHGGIGGSLGGDHQSGHGPVYSGGGGELGLGSLSDAKLKGYVG